jgi:hypothetical protein
MGVNGITGALPTRMFIGTGGTGRGIDIGNINNHGALKVLDFHCREVEM